MPLHLAYEARAEIDHVKVADRSGAARYLQSPHAMHSGRAVEPAHCVVPHFPALGGSNCDSYLLR